MGATSVLLAAVSVAFLYLTWRMNAEQGLCFCAVFPSNDPTGETLIAGSPGIQVPCDAEGKIACEDICIDMVEYYKEKAPQFLCDFVLEPLDKVKPALFSKTSGGDYEYMGLTSKTEVCCNAVGEPIICSE